MSKFVTPTKLRSHLPGVEGLNLGSFAEQNYFGRDKVYQILSQILNLCDTNLCYTSKSSLMFVLVFPSCAVRPQHNCDKKETQRK